MVEFREVEFVRKNETFEVLAPFENFLQCIEKNNILLEFGAFGSIVINRIVTNRIVSKEIRTLEKPRKLRSNMIMYINN